MTAPDPGPPLPGEVIGEVDPDLVAMLQREMAEPRPRMRLITLDTSLGSGHPYREMADAWGYGGQFPTQVQFPPQVHWDFRRVRFGTSRWWWVAVSSDGRQVASPIVHRTNAGAY